MQLLLCQGNASTEVHPAHYLHNLPFRDEQCCGCFLILFYGLVCLLFSPPHNLNIMQVVRGS